MTPINTGFEGFTLHTRSSLTIPGAWGALVLMYPPAAYVEARRLESLHSGRSL